jgi:hypothetical protein
VGKLILWWWVSREWRVKRCGGLKVRLKALLVVRVTRSDNQIVHAHGESRDKSLYIGIQNIKGEKRAVSW